MRPGHSHDADVGNRWWLDVRMNSDANVRINDALMSGWSL